MPYPYPYTHTILVMAISCKGQIGFTRGLHSSLFSFQANWFIEALTPAKATRQARRAVETSKAKNERCGNAEARAAGQVGMREPKKRQGSMSDTQMGFV